MHFHSILRLDHGWLHWLVPALCASAISVSCLPASAQPLFPQTVSRPVVDFRSQAVTYSVPIVGTPFQFNYRSNAVGPKWRFSIHHLYDVATETLSPGADRPRYATATFASPQASSWFSGSEMAVPADGANELYIFNNKGQHLRTLNALTGALLLRFDYSADGNLAAIGDGYGNRTRIERDGAGFMTAVVAPHGQRTTFSNDANGFPIKINSPAGATVSLKYANGELNAVTDPGGKTYQFTIDTAGHVTRFQDPASGFVDLTQVPSGKGLKVSWDTATIHGASFTAERERNGEATALFSDGGGATTRIESHPDTTAKATFPDGMVLTRAGQTDPRLGLQAALLKSLSISTPAGVTSALSLTRTIEPANAAGAVNVAIVTDNFAINGRSYTRSFDARNRQITLQTPAGRKAVATLGEHGEIAKVELPGLAPISLTYDSEGRFTGTTAGAGGDARVAAVTYNAQGWAGSVTDPLKRAIRFDYDPAGRVTKRTFPDGSAVTLGYDADGHLISVTPPGQAAHRFGYTPVSLISAYSPPDIGQVASGDANGFFTSIARWFARLWTAIRFYVLELFHVGSSAEPETAAASTSYAYNSDGQLTKITRPGRVVIDFAYDNAARLSRVAGAGAELRFNYDTKTGDLASVATADGGALNYTYDGPLLTQATWNGAVKGAVSFTYDNDLRVSSTSVNGEPPVKLEYDADGLLTQAGKLTLKPDPATGFLAGTALGDVTTAQNYNGFGEETAVRAAFKDQPLFAEQYDRDALGRIVRRTETINGRTVVYTYAYDSAGRLADVTTNGTATVRYSYDANGNRLAVSGPKGTIRASYDAQDRLTQYGNIVFKSTPNGEWSSKSAGGKNTNYDYDGLGNLKAVSLPDGTRIEYVVDGANRRIGKKVNGTLVQGYIYQDQLRPIAELDGQGHIVSRFVYGTNVNVPQYMEKGGKTYRIVTDHLGSPRLIVDIATGDIAQQLDYDEFGNVLHDTNPGFQPFGFAGGLYDPQTRLTRFGARDYDAETGRWTAKDPALFQGGDTDLFAYLLDDPMNAVDSTGLAPTGVTTVGVSTSGWTAGHSFVAQGGVVVGSQGDSGVFVDWGFGVGSSSPGWSAGVSDAFYPNATVTTDIKGVFANGSVGAGGGGLASVDGAIDPSNPKNFGIGTTVGVGFGFGGFFGTTNTLVLPLPWWLSVPTVYGDWLGDTRAADWWRCWTTSDASGCGSGWGDIHMQTFDGVHYDFQAAGEFLALQDRSGAVKMQIRLEPAQNRRVTYATAIAAQVDGVKVAIHLIKMQRQLYVDDKPVMLDPGARMSLGKNGAILSKGSSWVITWPDDTTATVQGLDHLDVLVQTGKSAGTLVGLFGNADGKPEGDLVTRDGVALKDAGGFTRDDLYGRFAESWRIRQEESLFHYGPGESTATFTDRTVPGDGVTVASLDATTRDKAERACRAAGITAPAALNDCILDFGVTGNASFVESASFAQAVAREPVNAVPAQNQTAPAGLPQGQSGIQLVLAPEAANLLWRWRVVKPDQPDKVIEQQDAAHLAISVPAGEYQIQTSALGSEGQWVTWPQKIQLQPGQQTQFRIDSGLRLDISPDLEKTVWRWRVAASGKPDQIIQAQGPDRRAVLLPPGEYQIASSELGSEGQWIVWPEKIAVQAGKQSPVEINSSLQVQIPAELAKTIWRWRVVGAGKPDQVLQTGDPDHRTALLPPGEYQIASSALGAEGQWIIWPQKIEVQGGKQAPVQIDSSLRLDMTPELAKTVWRWRLVKFGQPDQVIQFQDAGHRVQMLPPGDYQIASSALGAEGQWILWPQKIQVRSGAQAAMQLDSGIRLAGPGFTGNAQFQVLDTNGRTLQSWRGGALEPFPPGKYAIEGRADPSAPWKRLANGAEVRPGNVMQVTVPALR